MLAPTFRRAATRLTSEQIASLVAMRDAGTTWRDIGRVFGKQDCACKTIYDRAKAAPAAPPA